MKKNGFTLIELLAVIVILSILLLIGAPSLINNLNNKKQEASDKVKQLILSSARSYVIDYNLKEPLSLSISDLCGFIDCPIIDPYTDEEIKGYVVVDYDNNYNIVTELQKVSLDVTLGNGATTTQTFNNEYNIWDEIELVEPEKEGSEFSHWEVVKGDSRINGNKLTIGSTDTEIKAMWIKYPTFTINYDGGNISNPDVKTSYKTGTTIKLISPTKEGYTFKHWELTSGNGVISGNNYTMGDEDTVITAVWNEAIVLTVNTTAGFNVIAEMGDKKYTSVANEDGVAIFDSLESGTWKLTLSNGNITSEPVYEEILANKEVDLYWFEAYITVTYPRGTCTVTVGDITFTHSGGGTHTFTVDKKGAYTVKIQNGSLNKTVSGTISEHGQADTHSLDYDKFYVLNETPASGFAWSKTSSSGYAGVTPSTSVSQSSGFLKLTVSYIWEGYPAEATFATASTVNAYGYEKLYIKVNRVQQTVKLTFAGKTITLPTTSSESTSSIDLTSITTDTNSNLSINISTGGSSQGICQIMQIWLE